jgi:hypothetical protein
MMRTVGRVFRYMGVWVFGKTSKHLDTQTPKYPNT